MNFKGVNYWTPSREGTDFELSPILSPLAAFRNQMLVVSGLNHRQADVLDDGANGDHTRGTSTWLTGVHPKHTEGADVENGPSADQIAAAVLGKDTPLPSLELGLDLNYLAGNCENGYSCVYMNTLSWSSPTTPLPTENNPRVVFERLFGDGGTSAQRSAQARENLQHPRFGHRGSPSPAQDARPGRSRSPWTATSSRCAKSSAVFKRAEKTGAASVLPTLDRPMGIPERFDEHVNLMYDLQWLAFRADITRVTTFMLGRELNFRTYPEIGITEGHHGLSHHGDRAEQLAKYARLNTYQAQLFAGFLEKLRATPDGDGTLLDHSMFLYGAGLSNPNLHAHTNLPLAVFGGGVKGGRHMVCPREHAGHQPALEHARQVGHPGGHPRRQQREAACSNRSPACRDRDAPARTPLDGSRIPLLAIGRRRRRRPRGDHSRRRPRRQHRGRPAAVRRTAPPSTHRNPTAPRALHWAVQRNNLEIADLLIRAGAGASATNRYGVSPLYLACVNGNAAMIERLVAAGADVNKALPQGETPLMTAARTGNVQALRVLLAHGAVVNAREQWKGQTALMWAASENNAPAARALIEAGADLYAHSKGGDFTAYLFAVRGGHLATTRVLLDAGADVNETLRDGTSALVLSVMNGHYELAGLLLDYGADATADRQGWSALHQVAWTRRPNSGSNLPGAVPTGTLDSLDLVRKLLRYGADVNARQTKEPKDGFRNKLRRIGATPFLLAAKADDLPLMRLLLASRRRSEAQYRGRHDAADGGRRRGHLGSW